MKKNTFALVCCSLLLLLVGRFFLFYADGVPPREGEIVTLQTTLLTEPKLTGKDQSFSLYYHDRWRITVRMPRFPMFHYGDSISLKGKVHAKRIKSLGIEKTIYSLSYPTVIRQGKSSNYLVSFAGFIRATVSTVFHRFLPQPSDSLLMGIVFGINEGMPDAFQAALQRGGVLHVIAASGMNVSMVAGTLFFLLSKLMKRQHAVLISIIGVLFYAVLSGLQPSILRASLMGILVFSASLLGRQNTALLSLGITGYLMVLWKPILLFDVGFQLSFLSTLGILTIKPLFQPLERRFEALEDITTTISAQLATLPIMLITFGSYGILSVVVNALVLWTIPPLMVLGSLSALMALIMPVLAVPFLYLSLPLLWYFSQIVVWFGQYNLILSLPLVPVAVIIGYYLLLCSLMLFFYGRRGQVR